MPTSTSPSPDIKEVRKPSPFVSEIAITLYVALVRIAFYFLAATNYGYFRDELYYLACGNHPAWGYVDQPPLIGWIAWLLEHTLGTSLWALRLLPALADIAVIVLAGRLVRELGGHRWAVFLASLAVLMAPIPLALSHIFTMNAFDPLLWTAIAYLIVRLANTGNQRLWLSIGALAGITILNKYAILFWLFGLVVGLCLTPLRQSLRQRWFWLACAIATAIALPNLLWQWQHQFPFLQLMHNVRQGGRNVILPPLSFLQAQARMIGFVPALLVLFATFFFLSKRGQRYRALGWACLLFIAEMMFLRGKLYYTVPVFPILFAAGAVWIEEETTRRRITWIMPVYALAIAVVCGIYLPVNLPVLSVPALLAYEHRLGIEQQKLEHSHSGVLPQLYADMFGWEGIAQRVAAFYRTLSPEEQRNTAIFANNYGVGGAIDFYGPKYGLPKSIGGHQNYWLWGPRNYTGESVIVLGEGHERNMQTKCASYSIIGSTNDPLSRQDEWTPIYYCRGLFNGNLQAMWPQLKAWR